MRNKHLPRLFAQALNEKRVELFDEFIHPEYNNHNSYVEAGPAGIKAFFRHYLDAFPDTKVVMDDVIEDLSDNCWQTSSQMLVQFRLARSIASFL
jgi:predicted SnoaL-like aldol condensation-catalyzing enzyme